MYKKTQTGSIIRLNDGARIPADHRNQDYQSYLAWVAAGNTAQPVDQPTQQQITAAFTAAIQKRLDDFVATRNYDNVASVSKYTGLTDTELASLPVTDRPIASRFRAECRYLLLKTAQTWAVCERILQQVQAGARPMPKSIADIEAELPALVWPA